MLTIKDILTNKLTLDIECADRGYLNKCVKNLQMAGRFSWFKKNFHFLSYFFISRSLNT
jgi:hypothetical protein